MLVGSKIMLKNPRNQKVSIFKYWTWMSLSRLWITLYIANIVFFIGLFTGFSAILVNGLPSIDGWIGDIIKALLGIIGFLSLAVIIAGAIVMKTLRGYRDRVRKQILVLLIEGHKIVDEERVKIIITQHLGIPLLNKQKVSRALVDKNTK